MPRTIVAIAAILVAFTQSLAAQYTTVLRVRVSLADASGAVTPVARYRLLVSDNPASAPPREIVTTADGTADLKLKPGNYTVESDEPFVFEGKAYRWVQTFDVKAGLDVALDLTKANAVIEEPAAPAVSSEVSGTSLVAQWQHSIASLWTGTSRSSGFVVDARGLVATSQRAIGNAKELEVQLTPGIKVAGRVLAAEPGRDVAIIRVNPSALESSPPLPLDCGSASPPSPKATDRATALGAPLRGPKAAEYAALGRVGPHSLETDLSLATGSAGGPAFLADGRLVGLTSIVDGSDERRPDIRIIRLGDVCAVIASAEKAMGEPPSAERLPVEPTRQFPRTALEAAGQKIAGSRNPYQGHSADFDVAFITPALVYAARNQLRPKSLPVRGNRATTPDPYDEARQHAMLEFGRWADYFVDDPPVLLVRVTPRMVEGFWKALARGAAMSQGISIPAMKHFKSSFVRMQAFCGATEVRPIHPFTLTTVVSEKSSITEGLYVFHPDALGPRCGAVKLRLYSEQSPAEGDALTVDPKVLQQLWDEFEAWRAR
jgi:hypothetical protein